MDVKQMIRLIIKVIGIYILAYFSIPWRSNGRRLVRVYDSVQY